ncbi:endo-polygalacturonase PG1 [Gymnopus androsaceus JB14]|uniref:endo-polygalacturonase n=1 Tax=Gymnopus androsaceus JB14 TaxID=1447944 RepID=A0A6A4HZZ1_9AGAR|nr:endo-polygalacturonase PG1 [Gymnopus androsaceus JB14]
MFTSGLIAALSVLSLLSQVSAIPSAAPRNRTLNSPPKIGKRCTGEIQSLSDIAAAEECDTIVIGGFTVPAGETFSLTPPDGASVSLTGELTFGFEEWSGPLIEINGNDITFDGGGNDLDGQGTLYWDGQGLSGGTTKPDPMLTINMSGSFSNIQIVNSPARAVSVNGDSITISDVIVNNAAGTAPNSLSGDNPAGSNTDGFDTAGNDITITGCTVNNQDDCLSINKGTNIVFENNVCEGIGHGFHQQRYNCFWSYNQWNTVTGTVNGLRIKTDATATGSIVENVVYENNVITGITEFGVIIDQSYPDTLGTPGTGVVIENVSFDDSNTVSVESDANAVEVNCGSTSSCTGTWDWSGLSASGGEGSTIKNAPVTGFTA